MDNFETQLKFDVTLELDEFILIKNKSDGIDKDDAIEIGAYVFADFIHKIQKDKGKITKVELDTLLLIIKDFYFQRFTEHFDSDDFKSIIQLGSKLYKMENSQVKIKEYFISILKKEEKFINKYEEKKFVSKYNIDGCEIVIELDLDEDTGNAILKMDYIDEMYRQTISSSELREDLDLLVPNEVGEDPLFEENLLEAVMLEQLKKVIDKHIQKYGRLLKSDLATYVMEAIIVMEAYSNQVLKESFTTKKETTFQMLNNFYLKQLPDKWKL